MKIKSCIKNIYNKIANLRPIMTIIYRNKRMKETKKQMLPNNRIKNINSKTAQNNYQIFKRKIYIKNLQLTQGRKIILLNHQKMLKI